MGSELSWQFWIHLLTALYGNQYGNGRRALATITITFIIIIIINMIITIPIIITATIAHRFF